MWVFLKKSDLDFTYNLGSLSFIVNLAEIHSWAQIGCKIMLIGDKLEKLTVPIWQLEGQQDFYTFVKWKS